MEIIHCNRTELFEQLRSFIKDASSDCGDPSEAGLGEMFLYFKASKE